MDFENHLKKYLSDEEIFSLIDSFSKEEHKGLFLNPNKMSDEEFVSLFPKVRKHPIVPHAYLYDKNDYDFGKYIYHDLGCYYIQDPSATLVSYFLKPKENEYILDMCAAPGGKCVEASLLMNNKGVLYANDLSFKRAEILLSNVERMGLGNVVVLSKDLSKIKGIEKSFDGIILDAPCSGSGMFRKMSEMKDDWTYEKVKKQAIIQKELIMLAYSLLKEGGRMVYSTCSYSYEEDEEVVQYLLDNSNAMLINIPDNEMFYRSSLKETIHLFPYCFVGEGHYIALIQKPGKLFNNKCEETSFAKTISSKGKSKIVEHFLLPSKGIPLLNGLAIRPGLFTYSEIADKKIISHHYCHFLDAKESYPLSNEQLKKYIHGESLAIKVNKNYSLVSYKGRNVGVVNKVNDVLKNLYPKGLRR